MSHMKVVGIVGCGLMGSGIATTLLKADFDVYVYDIDQTAVERLTEKGANGAASISDLAAQVDVLILSLPSPKVIEEVLTNKVTGAFQQMKENSYVLDMSTNDLQLTKKLHGSAQI